MVEKMTEENFNDVYPYFNEKINPDEIEKWRHVEGLLEGLCEGIVEYIYDEYKDVSDELGLSYEHFDIAYFPNGEKYLELCFIDNDDWFRIIPIPMEHVYNNTCKEFIDNWVKSGKYQDDIYDPDHANCKLIYFDPEDPMYAETIYGDEYFD